MRKLIILLALAAPGFAATIITDTFTGTNGTLITAHTANTGNTWSSVNGNNAIALDGNGYVFGNAGLANITTVVKASGTFASNTLVTITFTVKAITNTGDDLGVGVTDSSGNLYILDFNTSGGLFIRRFTSGNVLTNIASSSTVVVLNTDYVCTLTVITNGTTVTLNATITQSGSPIWSSGNVTDTTYPTVNQVGIRVFTTAADTQTTGWHIGNLAAVTSGMTPSPTYIPVGTSGNVVALTGVGTAWVNGSTTFSLSGGTGASITAQSVASSTSASVTITAGSLTGSLTISNNTDAGTSVVTVVIPVTDSSWFFAPYCSQTNGSGTPNAFNMTTGATLVVWNNMGCYFKTDFVGTSASLMTVQNGVAGGKITWSVDNGTVSTSTLSGSTGTIQLATGLTNTTHTLWLMLTAINTTPDRWTGSPVPTQALGIGGMVVASGGSLATPSAEVAVLAKNCLFLGDSIFEGYGTDGLAVHNASESMVYHISRGFGCEFGDASFSGIGFSVGVGAANLPVFGSTWSNYQSGVTRLYSAKLSPVPDYVWIEQGTNDGSTNIITTAQTVIGSIRAAVNVATPIFVTVPIGQGQKANLTTVVGNIRATDTHTYLVDLGAIYFSGTRWSYDGVHPSAAGDAWIGSMFSQASESLLTTVTGAGSFPIGQ